MVRTLLFLLAFVAAQFAAGLAAYGRSPAEVTGSPIPPLHEPAPKGVSPAPQEQRAFVTNPLMPGAAFGTNARASLPVTIIPQGDDVAKTNTAAIERSEIWESDEMLKAREDVADFSRRSAQTNPGEGEKFLTRLSQLSPDEMRNWLERYQARRMGISLERDVEQMARQLMLERAINRQEATRQAYARVSNLRREATEAAQAQYLVEQLYAQQARLPRDYSPSYAMPWIFDPLDAIDAICDPSSPRGYGRRVAGAMSLPGDLPPNDPRNFMRGDEGADLGEWANSRDAQSSGPGSETVVDAPAEPVADAPEFIGPVAE